MLLHRSVPPLAQTVSMGIASLNNVLLPVQLINLEINCKANALLHVHRDILETRLTNFVFQPAQ